MRAVRTNAFVWAAFVVVVGLDERLAVPAAIIGLVLALFPMLFAPKIVPAANHEQGHHAGTLYKMIHPGQANPPVNPQPGDTPSYKNGSWS